MNKLDQQLAEYIALMKQKNKEEYSTSFIKVAIAAFYWHLNKNSIIKHINIYDSNIFTTLSEIANRKIKYLTDLRYVKTKLDMLKLKVLIDWVLKKLSKYYLINLWIDQYLKDY